MPRYQRQHRYGVSASERSIQRPTYTRNNNYMVPKSGIKRHEFTFINKDSTSPLASEEYVPVQLLNMNRTYGSGNDEPNDSPAASNVYLTNNAMNGSYISNYKSAVRLENRDSAKGAYCDIYTVCTSFFDVLNWDNVYEAFCPVKFVTDNTTPSHAGEVTFKSDALSYVTDVGYKSFKGVQHYMKKLGTIYLTPDNGGRNQHELNFVGLPPKIRRMS